METKLEVSPINSGKGAIFIGPKLLFDLEKYCEMIDWQCSAISEPPSPVL